MDADILKNWEAYMTAQGLSARTIEGRICTVTSLSTMAKINPEQIEAEHIIAFIARPGLTQNSKASYHASIRAFTAWMVRSGIREDNPAAQTATPKRVKGKPRPVATELITAMLRRARNKRTQAYIMLGFLAGMRVHEIAKIHGRDIDIYGQTLRIYGKGGKIAVIPLHPDLIVLARDYPLDDYWFPSYVKAGHVTAKNVSRAIKETMLAVGYDGNAHQLRHSYGTELLRGGADLRIVQELMRHESPATTAIYTQVAEDQLRNAISLLKRAA